MAAQPARRSKQLVVVTFIKRHCVWHGVAGSREQLLPAGLRASHPLQQASQVLLPQSLRPHRRLNSGGQLCRESKEASRRHEVAGSH